MNKYRVGTVFKQRIHGKEVEGVVIHNRSISSDYWIIWNNLHDLYNASREYTEKFIDEQVLKKEWEIVKED